MHPFFKFSYRHYFTWIAFILLAVVALLLTCLKLVYSNWLGLSFAFALLIGGTSGGIMHSFRHIFYKTPGPRGELVIWHILCWANLACLIVGLFVWKSWIQVPVLYLFTMFQAIVIAKLLSRWSFYW